MCQLVVADLGEALMETPRKAVEREVMPLMPIHQLQVEVNRFGAVAMWLIQQVLQIQAMEVAALQILRDHLADQGYWFLNMRAALKQAEELYLQLEVIPTTDLLLLAILSPMRKGIL